MNDFLNKVIGNIEDKKEWRATMARAKTLPEDYRVVYNEISGYIMSGGPGVISTIKPFKRLLGLFEEGAAHGKHVLEVTGDDIAAFSDELVSDEEPMEDWHEEQKRKLNSDIAKKLGK